MKSVVILAAGMGSRFGGPKQIEPVGPSGEFIIDYSIYDAIRTGFDNIVLVIRPEHREIFEDTICKRIGNKIKIEFAEQSLFDIPKESLKGKREKPWGTVQAVLVANKYTDGDFIIINADDFYGKDAFIKAAEFLDNNHNECDYANISYPFDKTASKYGAVKRGVLFTDEDGYITNIVESKIELDGDNANCEPLDGSSKFVVDNNHPVSMNLFAFKNGFFNLLNDYWNRFFDINNDEDLLTKEALLPDVVKENLFSGKIKVFNRSTDACWIGMTYKEDLPLVKGKIQDMVDDGEYPSNLWG